MDGDMLAAKVSSKCETIDGDKEFCICDNDECTSSRKKLKEEKGEKVTCKCTAGTKGCMKGKCEGDLCFWNINHRNKAITKGCLYVSVPLLERRAIDSCMLPPMSGSMHSLSLKDETFNKDLLKTESCVCSTDNCNSDRPFEVEGKLSNTIDSQSCDYKVIVESDGKTYSTEKGKKCKGEFCYKMKLTSEEEIGKLESYTAEGCATFDPNRETMDEEFTKGICGNFTGNGLWVQTCYKTEDESAKRRLEKVVERTREGGEEEDNEEEEEEEIDITIKEKEVKNKGRSNGKKEDEKEEEESETAEEKKEEEKEEKKEEEKEKEKSNGETVTTKKFVFLAPTEAPTPDESNATMITVFVLIILCICVAGITWKFQLHRKLMRANYDTVAGG